MVNKKQRETPKVRNFFYEEEETIGNNLLFDWFKKKIEVIVVLNITDKNNEPYKLTGTIISVGQFEIVLKENGKLRFVYKQSISSIRENDK